MEIKRSKTETGPDWVLLRKALEIEVRSSSKAWRCMIVCLFVVLFLITVIERMRQEDSEFEASLS